METQVKQEEDDHSESPTQLAKDEPVPPEAVTIKLEKDIDSSDAQQPDQDAEGAPSEPKQSVLDGEREASDPAQLEQEGDGESSDEDDVKVTIEDYDIRAAQKQQPQPQQPKIDFEAAVEVDINNLDEKPWRNPGADLNDYFNYGFDETIWRMYCDKQKKMKAAVNELQETHRIPVINKPSHQHSYHHIPVLLQTNYPPSMVIPPPHLQRDIVGGGSGNGVGDVRLGRGEGRMPREHSSHRRSRSPHSKPSSSSRHHGRIKETKERRRSRSRESSHRRSSGKESRKRRSRSRDRDDERHKSKRHRSSRKV